MGDDADDVALFLLVVALSSRGLPATDQQDCVVDPPDDLA
jgi:hypothetical protein